ncbi:hypothetical protein [Marinoscillum sp.]|uniref:hypothetical protein n=1 Tax=Marinoscillum sp. TaxID=2024838 RepID=UPI003BAA2DCE
MKKLRFEEFQEGILTLLQATSVKGKIYHDFSIQNGKVRFKRSGKSTYEYIDLDELYSLYCKVDRPTNTQARAYVTGRVQSPAVSIINALSR